MKYNVTRTITITASKSKVKNLVQNFTQWKRWSPWTIAEPDCDISVEGTVGEVGHKMSWDGEIIGSGENILTSVSDDRLDYDLNFFKPWKSSAKVSFFFESNKKSTTVAWTMEGNMPFFMFFMIPMMKAWIGMDYDRGLKMLKALAEEGKVEGKTTNKGVTSIDGFSYVGIQRTVYMNEIGELMPKDFDQLIADIVVSHGKSAQHWVSLYPKMDMKKQTMTYIAAVSDEELEGLNLGDEYVKGEVKSGTALEIFHKGRYDFIGNAWSMGMMYLRAKKMKQSGVPFEKYWNSPKEVKPEKLETSVFFPLK